MQINKCPINESLSIVSSILGIFSVINAWKSEVFKVNKIQRYKLKEYQYTKLIFRSIYVYFNPILLKFIFFAAKFLGEKIDSDNYTQIFLGAIFYFIFILLLHIFESEILKSKKRKLEIALSSISEKKFEKEKQKLLYESNDFLYNLLMLNFVLLIPFMDLNAKNYFCNIIMIIEILVYITSILVINFKASRYKNKLYVKSKTVIIVDYTKKYGCFSKMTLKEGFSVKDENNYTIIFYPKDISLYTIKPENLINISIGYEIASEKKQ